MSMAARLDRCSGRGPIVDGPYSDGTDLMAVADGAVTSQLAAYAATAKYSDLPEAVRLKALRPVFNIPGCMLGARPPSRGGYRRRVAQPLYWPARATLIGRGRNADALHAALINCLASSIYSFDDTHA